MKNMTHKLAAWCAVLAVGALLPATARAQAVNNFYVNADWQYNVPLGTAYADRSSGWGASFDGGYYFPCNVGVGVFLAYHTNNQYIDRQTLPLSIASAITTDQQHSVYQVPFGAAVRYRFTSGRTLEPYVGAKVGTNYARIASYFYILQAYEQTWGFYMSPEVGLTVHPFQQSPFGIHVALYYSYATNQGTVMDASVNRLNNFGFRVGVAF